MGRRLNVPSFSNTYSDDTGSNRFQIEIRLCTCIFKKSNIKNSRPRTPRKHRTSYLNNTSACFLTEQFKKRKQSVRRVHANVISKTSKKLVKKFIQFLT